LLPPAGALADAIKAFNGGVVIISHHHEFTSALCNTTWRVADGQVGGLLAPAASACAPACPGTARAHACLP
jgi:ATPase subunit of ABC transporter with duplicated ATPase domains